jgi:hypothetical protein
MSLYLELEEDNDRGYGLSHEMYRKQCKDLGHIFEETTHTTIYLESLIKHPIDDKYALKITNDKFFPQALKVKLKDPKAMKKNGWQDSEINAAIEDGGK